MGKDIVHEIKPVGLSTVSRTVWRCYQQEKYELIAALYLSNHRERFFAEVDSTEKVDQACRERYKLRVLGVARGRYDVKLNQVEDVFKGLTIIFSINAAYQSRVTRSKLDSMRYRLVCAIVEREMIVTFWETYNSRFAAYVR